MFLVSHKGYTALHNFLKSKHMEVVIIFYDELQQILWVFLILTQFAKSILVIYKKTTFESWFHHLQWSKKKFFFPNHAYIENLTPFFEDIRCIVLLKSRNLMHEVLYSSWTTVIDFYMAHNLLENLKKEMVKLLWWFKWSMMKYWPN